MKTDLAAAAIRGECAEPRPEGSKGFGAAMGGAAASGFCAGALGHPAWQVAVESAQVLAGVVSYPAGNPFGLYHAKLWTLLHQALAPLLAAGVTERTLSVLLSGALGAVAFMAFAAMVFALSRDWLASVGAPLVIYYAGAAGQGVVYPVLILGTSHTYGSLGLSFAMLAAGLLGAGRTRSGAFLLGVAPAVHPSVGALVCLAVCLAVLTGRKDRGDVVRRGGPWLAAGAFVAAVSLAFHLSSAPASPAADPDMQVRCLRAFQSSWDVHRAPAPVFTRGVGLNAACVAVCFCWLFAGRERLGGAALLLRTLVAAAGLGAAGAVISWLPAGVAPRALTALMPARMLNVATFSYMALALGLLGAGKNPAWLAGWLAATLLILRQKGPYGVEWAMLAVAPVLCWRAWGSARPQACPGAGSRGAPAARIALAALLCFVLVQSARKAWRSAHEAWPALRDRTNDAFFEAVAKGRGVVAPGPGVWLAQLRSRRPMLLDACALDMLPYAPAAGPEMERILREFYGVSLLKPPPGMARIAVIPDEPSRAVWEARSAEQWRRVGAAFGVTEVMTVAGWRLKLPLTSAGDQYMLYAIPAAGQTGPAP